MVIVHASKPLVPATQQHLVPATKVMTMMYDFIEEFFGCHSCKLVSFHLLSSQYTVVMTCLIYHWYVDCISYSTISYVGMDDVRSKTLIMRNYRYRYILHICYSTML